jgi:hypothetical protein
LTGSRRGSNSDRLRRDRREAVFLFVAVREYVLGTKRTYRVALHMSAIGGKADIPLAS